MHICSQEILAVLMVIPGATIAFQLLKAKYHRLFRRS
jgi:hypothetical protein